MTSASGNMKSSSSASSGTSWRKSRAVSSSDQSAPGLSTPASTPPLPSETTADRPMQRPCVPQWPEGTRMGKPDTPYSFLQQLRLRYSGNFAVSVLTPAEAIVVHFVVFGIMALLGLFCTRYLPQQFSSALGNLRYYLLGPGPQQSALRRAC